MIGASRLVKATLTLRKSDLHPIEQTLVVQRGEQELREYKFVETEFELIPAKEVAPATFAIEAELTGKVAASGSAGNFLSGTLPMAQPPQRRPQSLLQQSWRSTSHTLLNLVKADRNEQVALTRSASGSLRVEGIVDTAERRDEYLRALRPFSNNPAVSIDIRTVAEAAKQQPHAGTQSVREVEDTGDAIAVEEDSREYFTRRGLGGEAADEAARGVSSRVVNHGYRALFQAIELKRLVARFSRVDLRTVAPDARTKWLEMMRSHARKFARENASCVAELPDFLLQQFQMSQKILRSRAMRISRAQWTVCIVSRSRTTTRSVRRLRFRKQVQRRR